MHGFGEVVKAVTFDRFKFAQHRGKDNGIIRLLQRLRLLERTLKRLELLHRRILLRLPTTNETRVGDAIGRLVRRTVLRILREAKIRVSLRALTTLLRQRLLHHRPRGEHARVLLRQFAPSCLGRLVEGEECRALRRDRAPKLLVRRERVQHHLADHGAGVHVVMHLVLQRLELPSCRQLGRLLARVAAVLQTTEDGLDEEDRALHVQQAVLDLAVDGIKLMLQNDTESAVLTVGGRTSARRHRRGEHQTDGMRGGG